MTRTNPPTPLNGREGFIAGSAFLGFAAIFLLVTMNGRFGPMSIDAYWDGLMQSIQTPVLVGVAKVFDVVGGTMVSGVLIPALLALALFVRHRWRSALFLISASAVSAVVVQIVKAVVARPRPEDMMVISDSGSFPSGHSANAIVLVLILMLIFTNQKWIPYVGGGYVLLMMWSRTYLHAHWISDTVGGVLLGITVVLVIWAAISRRFLAERHPPGHDPNLHMS